MINMSLFVSVLQPFMGALNSRIFLDLIPSEFRNSIYSLFPTVSGVLAFILLPIIGSIIEVSGMISSLMIMLGIASFGIIFISLSLNSPEKISSKHTSADVVVA